ncbi:hypothetical protein, partial [Rhabdochromatium marinum]|uniref:hypothetical protein n=1 Tax=Rhabdochromatium marinum TaxID=48729 RepID=UPI001A91F6F1
GTGKPSDAVAGGLDARFSFKHGSAEIDRDLKSRLMTVDVNELRCYGQALFLRLDDGLSMAHD